MKKLFTILFLIPIFLSAQNQLTLSDILTINDKDSFLKIVKEKSYSEGNLKSDKIYFGKGLSVDKTQATDWAEYTLNKNEFYFEQSDIVFVRKHKKKITCYYDIIVSDIKKSCKQLENMMHESTKNGEVNFSTYKCKDAKFKGTIGFAMVNNNGVIQEFPE
jgi:hypothetical protein